MQCYRCVNNPKLCYKCFSGEFFKEKFTVKNKKPSKDKGVLNSKKSWENLEEEVVKKLNNSRRTRASGALPFEKGDVLDSILHPECKERAGTSIKQGADKTFSIQKSWLLKAKEEAMLSSKTMCLPFRFKGDTDIFVVIELDALVELVNLAKEVKK